MPAEEKEYTVIQEANDIVAGLKERYPRHLWPVIPDEITVLGITNKDRPRGMRKVAWIKKIEPEMRAVLGWLNSGLKYYIEVYCSDYTSWGTPRKQWIMFHELLHVPGPMDNGLIKHDIEDFAVMVETGWDWFEREHLPNLMDGDPFPFKQGLVDKLHTVEDVGGLI